MMATLETAACLQQQICRESSECLLRKTLLGIDADISTVDTVRERCVAAQLQLANDIYAARVISPGVKRLIDKVVVTADCLARQQESNIRGSLYVKNDLICFTPSQAIAVELVREEWLQLNQRNSLLFSHDKTR